MPPQDSNTDPNTTPQMPNPAGDDAGSVINVSTPGNAPDFNQASAMPSPLPSASPATDFTPDTSADTVPVSTPGFDANPVSDTQPVTIASATTASDYSANPAPAVPTFGADQPVSTPTPSVFPASDPASTPTPVAAPTPMPIDSAAAAQPATAPKSAKKGLIIAAVIGGVIIILMLVAVLVLGQSSSDQTDLNSDVIIDSSLPQ